MTYISALFRKLRRRCGGDAPRWIAGGICRMGIGVLCFWWASLIWNDQFIFFVSIRLVHANVIPMGIPWETSHGKHPMGNSPWDGMGQHTFVFPMRLTNRMRVSECYWIVILRLYFWIL